MFIHVLGSAAGGGFPQWNCNCHMCHGLRSGRIKATPRTQSSIAITGDDENWVIINTSPDILGQISAFPALQPARARRDTAIRAIVLIDSQIDHTTGLLMLREGCPHDVYCSDMVYEDLTSGFPLFRILEHWNGGINRQAVPLDGSEFSITGIDGLAFTAIAVHGKAPPYSPHRHNPHPGDNIGLQVRDTRSDKTLFYAPGLAEPSNETLQFMKGADCLLVDGTFWQESEMVSVGLGHKKAADMGHLPQSGRGGLMEVLRPMERPRKVLIHINNTNPILDEASEERSQLQQEGIEIGYDGMDIRL